MRIDIENSTTNSDSHDEEEMEIVTTEGDASTTTPPPPASEEVNEAGLAQEKVKSHIPRHDAPSFSPGAIVYFTGLLELPELNGIQGTVEDYDDKKDRYNVTSKMLSKTVSVKSCNLCSTIEQPSPAVATAFFSPGTSVAFMGLMKAPELNGTEGVVEDYDDVKGRYNVVSKVFSKTVSVKTCNLVIKNGTDTGSILGTEKGKVAELAFDKVVQEENGRIPVENISSLLGEVGKKFDGNELEAQVAVLDPTGCGFITRSSFVDWFSHTAQETNSSMMKGEPLVKNGDKGNGPDNAVCVEATETSSNIFISPLTSTKTTHIYRPKSDKKAVGAAASGSDVLGLDGKARNTTSTALFNVFTSMSTLTFGPPSERKAVDASSSNVVGLDGKRNSTSTPLKVSSIPATSGFSFGSPSSNCNARTKDGFNFSSSSAKPTFSFGGQPQMMFGGAQVSGGGFSIGLDGRRNKKKIGRRIIRAKRPPAR